MNYSSRFWLFAPLAALFALALGAMAHGWMVQEAVEKNLDRINGHEALPGITISFASKTVSGFPFNLDILFTGLVVEGQGAHGPFRWSSEKFALHRLTYGPAQDIYEAAGNQTLSWTDGSGRAHALKFLPGVLHASAALDSKGLSRFDLELVAAGGSDSGGGPFTLNDAQLHLRHDPKADALDLMVKADEVSAREDIARLFGGHIKSLTLYASLTPGSGFAPLLAGTQSWSQASVGWRARGGKVTIGPVAIASSGVNLSANSFADSGDDLRGFLDPLY